MHVGDMTVGMIPAIAIVGGNIPLTTGLALACKRLGKGQVAVSLHGRRRDERGRVPRRAQHGGRSGSCPPSSSSRTTCTPRRRRSSWTFKIENIADRAGSYGMRGEIVRRHGRAGRVRGRGPGDRRGARAAEGPTLLECKTYRLCGHSRSDPRTYRSKEEEAEWATRDPILRLAAQLKEAGLADRREPGRDRAGSDRRHRRRGGLRRKPARPRRRRRRWKMFSAAKARSRSPQYGGAPMTLLQA